MSLYSARVAQDSPLFYFENNSSGVNNTGSITPSIVTGSSTQFISTGGVSNTAYMYNAGRTGEYGFEYSNSSTIFNDREFSITGWFKVNSTDISSNPDYIFHAGTTANGIYLQKTDKLYVGARFNGVSVATSTAPSFDEWHHVAVTMDTSNLKLYIDGTLIQTVSSPASLSIDSLVKYWGRATTSGTPRNGVKGNLDEWAVFNTTLSSTTIGEHYVTGFGILYNATPATASALMAEATHSHDGGYAAQAATASATSPDASWNFVNFPSMLDTYMQTLSFEQWYRFDQTKKIRNYGTGGNAEDAWAFNGSSINRIQGGRQGSGALEMIGQTGNKVQLGFNVTAPVQTEISDNEFQIGFWFKGEAGYGDYLANPVVYYNPFSSNRYYMRIRDTGWVEWNFQGSQSNQALWQANILDNNWHFIELKASASNNIISINIDNGTAVTTNPTGSWPTGLSLAQFGDVLNAGSNTKKGWMSHYWVTGYNSITSTQIGNMITYAGTPIQAASMLPEPGVKFTNAYNDYIQTENPEIDLRFDEASGTPVNYGDMPTFSSGFIGSNVTYLQPTVNRYAYRFTNADTYIQGDWTATSGTYTTNATQTMVVRFKSNGYTTFNQILASSGQKGFLGTGITISLLANSGHIEAKLNRGFGPTDTETITWTTNVADNEWHLAVACKSGSNFTLYVDGKQRAQITNSAITPADSGTWGIAAEGKYNTGQGAASKDLYIDEFALMSAEITAQEAFEMYQAVSLSTTNTISALMVNPAYSAGFGPTISASPMIATAEEGAVFPFVVPLTGQALFQQPNFEAIKNTSNAVTVWTASALFEDTTFSVGEYNGAQHMDASATMGDHRVFIPGFWNASPMIANPAGMVNPTFTSTQGALIKPQAMPAKAIFVTPPAYKLITDDMWYSKLYLQHSVVHGEEGYTAGVSSAYAFLKLFDDVTSNLQGAVTSKLTNNLPYSIVIDNPDNTATTVTYATASNEFLTASPTPLLETGYYDEFERKSVRFRNIQFKIAEDIYKADGPYSLEFTFKTTKANQVIAQGLQRSFTGSQSATSSIGLIDGKLFASRATQPIGSARIFAHPDNKDLVTLSTAYGNKSIADGAWHHIIIQYGFDGRVQFWIDGQLDIQFFSDSIYGRGAKLRPYILGSNHTNSRWQSDFETSAWSYDAAFFVESDDITDHYTASIKYEPVHAEPAIANADMPEPAVSGNRPRALMLYFWPTSIEQITNLSYSSFTSDESPEELGTVDYYTSPPQEYEGWDVFPVDVTGRYVSDLVNVEAYGAENISLTTPSGSTKLWKINKRRTFRDELTDAPRYIDLINDIDLTKFDMIIFKNYPNDPKEKDAFSTNEVVDAYFNLRESAIFEEFLKSLRAAVDTGLSLIVTNPQLALDLKIVDRVETVPDMDDLSGYESDPYAPTQVPQAANLDVTTGYPFTHHWWDTWKNNRARVVNTQAGLTDSAGLVRTQMAFWNNDDNGVRYGGPDRPFNRYEHKSALTVGDEFLLSSEPNQTTRKNFEASPISAVKAGKVITAFANTVRRGLEAITNPYKDYAISIAVNPGDILDGTQVGGKIFVNFTENINKSIETGDVDLQSDYWINYAYENGAIDADQRDAYLAAEWNTNTTPYWSSDGMNILVQVSEIQDENLSRKGTQTSPAKTRKVNKDGGISFKEVASGSQYFALQYSWQYPRATFEVPSIITKGFRWLSNREVLEGTVIRPTGLTATAEMPNALGIPDKVNSFAAQAMVATATIEETQFSSGTKIITVLPMTATATIVKPGSTIGVTPMTANAILRLDSKASVAAEDQVTLYLIHVDPILYIREDVIK